ncbi:hypothetical protein [Leucobacter japonicus]|uniref:hypothetical protein n=1 Tax=Leucobacter japonicus TaxID=1461259 RepID=UPI0012E2549E|nr:hypothetical protein [Leucobacter japonicus]
MSHSRHRSIASADVPAASSAREAGRIARHASLGVALALATALALGVTGCSSAADTRGAQTSDTVVAAQTSAHGTATESALAPGATLDARSLGQIPESTADWHVVVISSGDTDSQIVSDALLRLAPEHLASVDVRTTDRADESLAHLLGDPATTARPDLIVGIGPATAGAFDLLSAANLDQQFLMLGTQLAEPTDNVTAAVWPGADERAVFADRAPSFFATPADADTAVRAGITAAATGWNGFVFEAGADPAPVN